MNNNISTKLLVTIIKRECKLNIIDTLDRAIASSLQTPCNEGTYAAAIICSLYLSHYKLKFPVSKLRTFYTNIKDEVRLPLFDCKSYNIILSTINDEELTNSELIDENGNITHQPLTKAEIFEALDFYTNQ
jgi:hypothetical protein